jgi:nitrite reductase/ring-hydroxylating ferredoxin subunit
MPSANSDGYRKGLVDLKAGTISREIFVNEAIYQEELERVFTRAWLFVGHESQIPGSGDFVVSGMGEESVILCRDRAGEVHVFLNSCRHRGMKVCRYDEGNTAVFTCPYHGWSYGTDGRLAGVPFFREAYHSTLDRSLWGLVEVAQLALQGNRVGDLGPGGAALPRISRRFPALSRPEPRWLGRQRRRQRGAGRGAEMADPVQLEIPRREFQR